jgi:hypothetical protein
MLPRLLRRLLPARLHHRPTRTHRLPSPLLAMLLLPLLLPLAGCPLPAPNGSTTSSQPTALETFQTMYGNAVKAVDTVNITGDSLYKQGLITKAQGQTILSITEKTKSVLDASYAAAQLGNTAVASGDLAQAMGSVVILSTCLTQQPLTPATFDKCTSTLTAPKEVSQT